LISFAFARKIRFPSLKNLYSRGVDGTQSPGNPDLQEEQSDNFDISYTRKINNGRLNASFFYYNIDNYILFNNLRGVYYQTDAKIYGAELSTVKNFFNNLNANFSTTILRAFDKLSKLPTKELEYRPKYQMNLCLTYTPDFIKIVWNNKYVSKQTAYNYRKENFNNPAAQITKLDDYYVSDIKLQKDFNAYHSLYLYVQNIFNKNYFDMLYMPAQGRTFNIGYSAKF